jgi:hypothetical protein
LVHLGKIPDALTVWAYFHGSVRFRDRDFLSALNTGVSHELLVSDSVPRPGCHQAFKAVGYHAQRYAAVRDDGGLFLRATAGS